MRLPSVAPPEMNMSPNIFIAVIIILLSAMLAAVTKMLGGMYNSRVGILLDFLATCVTTTLWDRLQEKFSLCNSTFAVSNGAGG